VPYPGLTQSFNRYSYVHNNPLTYTDPSGFTLEFGGLFDIDGGISLSFKWGGRKHSRQQAPSPVKGCFVPAASGCYGKAPASGLFDIVFDVLRGPMPNYGRYDDLVLYYNDPNGFGRFENEIILVEDIATGVFYEFILLPIEEAAAGRLYSAACKLVKLCRIAERFGGRLLDYAVDKGKRFLKRKVEGVPSSSSQRLGDLDAFASQRGGPRSVRNVQSGIANADGALRGAEQWLGEGYREIVPGVFRSKDGLRQFRMTNSDLADPRLGPHVHFESIAPDGRTIIENSHVLLE
jgi:hypothetical protein